jgi:hypothetical protein
MTEIVDKKKRDVEGRANSASGAPPSLPAAIPEDNRIEVPAASLGVPSMPTAQISSSHVVLSPDTTPAKDPKIGPNKVQNSLDFTVPPPAESTDNSSAPVVAETLAIEKKDDKVKIKPISKELAELLSDGETAFFFLRSWAISAASLL